MFIGEIPLKRVEYYYWNGRFSRVHLEAFGSGCHSLFDAFVDRFGQSDYQLGMAPNRVGIWIGLKTRINFIERSCGASLKSAAIVKEKRQLQEAAEAEAEAKAKALREADKRPDF